MARAHPEIAGLVDWRPLARGGFSTVWQARQETLDRLVAVKVDHRPLSEDKERRRFLREAGAAGRLSNHRGIVTVHDAGILPDGRPFLVMDLCPGGSLTQWLRPEGRRSQKRVRDVGVRIADALAAAHARGVLHRDVKPANILIDSYDEPGLADFGLAAMPEAGVELSVTLEGMTPAYAPKEVFYLEPPTEFGDVYSLAATLYALLDGKPPRWPDTGTPSLPQLLELQRQPIERLPDVDEAFMDVLLRAMDDDPTQRPTAAEFRNQLEDLTFAPSTNSNPMVMPGSRAAAPATGGKVAAGAGAAALSGATAVPVPAVDTPGARPAHDGVDSLPPRAGTAGSASPLSPRRRRALTAIAVVTAILLTVLAVQLFDGGPTPGVANPAPSLSGTTPVPVSPSASSPSPTPTPTASPLPEGFADCSKAFGYKSVCVEPDAPECWVKYYSYADLRAIADITSCKDYHLLQTFAAGQVPVAIDRQSVLMDRKEVKALCTREVLKKVLVGEEPLKDWEIQVLPPPLGIDDNLFRCLVGPARTGPHKFKVAR